MDIIILGTIIIIRAYYSDLILVKFHWSCCQGQSTDQVVKDTGLLVTRTSLSPGNCCSLLEQTDIIDYYWLGGLNMKLPNLIRQRYLCLVETLQRPLGI